MLTADQELEEAYINLFEHFTVERQREAIRNLQKIYYKQQGLRGPR